VQSPSNKSSSDNFGSRFTFGGVDLLLKLEVVELSGSAGTSSGGPSAKDTTRRKGLRPAGAAAAEAEDEAAGEGAASHQRSSVPMRPKVVRACRRLCSRRIFLVLATSSACPSRERSSP